MAAGDMSAERLATTLDELERRMKNIEDYLGLAPEEEAAGDAVEAPVRERPESLEYRLGRDVFPKLGILALIAGMVFLLTLPLTVLPSFIGNTLGFVVAGGLLLLSIYWSSTFSQFARYLSAGAMLLLFFATLRLHYFTPDPVVSGLLPEILLLVTVVAVNVLISLRASSRSLTGISYAMACATLLLSEEAYVVFLGLILLSLGAMFLSRKREWPELLVSSIGLTYLTFFLWSVNNPLFGGEPRVMTEPLVGVFFLHLYAALFVVAILMRREKTDEQGVVILSAFLNTLLPIALLLFLALMAFREHFVLLHVSMGLVFIGSSIVFWMKETSRYSTFFYTMAGNMVLSAAILFKAEIPEAFLWLCLQSFMVISLAIWFRSRIIVVANFGIFLVIFLVYLVLAPYVDAVSLVFGVVAILSARIMNWQKDRLELKADMLRNSYLLAAMFILPYALYHMVPATYVGLSWMGLALFYFAMSRLLRNFKYRWMAMSTLFLSVLHIAFVATTSLQPVYRIVSFIALGLILLFVSLWYFKTSSTNEADDANGDAASDANPPAAL